MFEHKVRQNVYEERQNQLRWQVKLGEDQITGTERAIVLTERENAHDEYKVNTFHKIKYFIPYCVELFFKACCC